MKRYSLYVAFITLFVIITMTGCGLNSSEDKVTVKGVNGKEYENYKDACRDQDYEAAHIFLDKLYSSYETAVKENSDFSEDGDKSAKLGGIIQSAAIAYCNAADYVYSQELQFLADMDEEDSWKRALLLVKEMNVVGIKYPTDYHQVYYNGSSYFFKCYQLYVSLRNRQCNILLDLAIDSKKKDIAKKIIRCFCENCKIPDHYPYKIYYDKEDIDAAQAKYDEAFGEKEEAIEEGVQSSSKESKKKRRK